MYRAIEYFIDLQDNGHEYNAGDEFPRVGLTVPEERIAELSSSDNLRGMPLIAEVQEKPRRKKK